MRSIDRVLAAARDAGLAIALREMPQSTRTAEEAALACGTSVAQIVKTLLFCRGTSREPVMLLVSGGNRVDEAALGSRLGDRLERMDARAVRDMTGFAIGGVAPIGALAPMATFMDRELLSFDSVWAAAGGPNTVFSVDPRDLATATRATVVAMR